MNSARLDRVARSVTLAVFVIAFAAFVAAPFLALTWAARPFPGFVVEQTLVVADVDGDNWSGRQAGLRHPERVTHLNDRPIATLADFDAALSELGAFRLIEVRTLSPDGSIRTYPQVAVRSFPPVDLLRLFWLPYGVGLAYLLIGAWVYRTRGETRPGRAFAFFCIVVALVSGLLFDLSTTHIGPALWTLAIAHVGGALTGLALRFPEEWNLLERVTWLRFLPYFASIGLSAWGLSVLDDASAPWAYVLPWRYSYAYAVVGVVFFLGMTLYRRLTSPSVVARQQARIILWSSLVAFAPTVVWLAAPMLGASLTFDPLLFLPGLLVFPAAVAYAIIRHRLLDVDRVLRLGLGYAILTGILTLGFAVVIALARAVIGSQVRFNDPIPLAVLIIVLVVGLEPLRSRVQHTIDRMFFRDAIDYRAALEAFSRDLTHILDLDAILALLRERLNASLHPARVRTFLCDEPAQHYNEVEAPGGQPARFRTDGALVQRLAREEGALTFAAGESLPSASAAEREAIAALEAIVFVPLRSQGRLIGWLALGPRRSGQLYHGDDLAFLAAIANLAAVAIERANLQERALAERQLRKELELASRIQHSFLPQELPHLPGWEFSAFYASARQVGGDFYDFIELDEAAKRRPGLPEPFRQADPLLGLVIADVSDKGVPAALFMAVSRTLVRAMTIGGRSPADAIQRVNSLIHRDSRSEQFITLFYGVLDPAGAAMRFVNAGHNPPMLVRGESGDVFSLRAPGIIVGIFPTIRLNESEAQLEPGDVLLLYTDGVIDAVNAQREEFGTERLARLLVEHRQAAADDLKRIIVERVREFVGDTEPFDDMTLVVVKRVARS
jgi:sigma-B regulation protein RsbU (phosphoserine phosphatase)